MKSVVEEVIDSKARKLNNTMKKLTTDVALLKAENEDLRRTVRIERSRRRREKPLFDDLEINDEAKRVFFSPNKIQTTRDRQCYDSSYASRLIAMLMTMLMAMFLAIVDRSSLGYRVVSKPTLFRVSLCSSESYR